MSPPIPVAVVATSGAVAGEMIWRGRTRYRRSLERFRYYAAAAVLGIVVAALFLKDDAYASDLALAWMVMAGLVFMFKWRLG